MDLAVTQPNKDIDIKLEEILPKLGRQLQDKLMYSINLLRKAEKIALHYDPENGFYNTFSGGKDSQAMYHVMKLAGVKFRTHMSLTSIDPPEVIRFVKREYPDVELVKPNDSIFNVAVRKGTLPTMRMRWCCQEYKENRGAGKVTTIGIRRQESARRSHRREVEISTRKFSRDLETLSEYRKSLPAKKLEMQNGCISGKESILVSPILYWTERDVWGFLEAVGARHCSLYDKGHTRIGCICCPMQNKKIRCGIWRSTRTCAGTGFRQSKGSCRRGVLRSCTLRYWRYVRPQRNRRLRK
nr:MAG TPA: phosphoadenosine-phosphosulfate reductase [Caudoviricetes sp.]